MITVVHLITGLETGGAERMLSSLVTGSDRGRFRSVVVSMIDAGTFGPLIADAGVPVHTLGMRRGLPNPRGILRFARILRELRPAILQTWLYHADILGLLMRRVGQVSHLVWGLHGSDTTDAAALRRLLARWSARPDAVVTVSLAGQIFHKTIGYHPQRWAYIPNGFDTKALRPDLEARRRGRAALGIAEDTTAILLPARHHPMKDHANFLAAAARLAGTRPDVVFFLAGIGTDRGNPALAAAIARHRLGDRVVQLGDRLDLDRLYPAFDITTLSSAFGEGMPMVLGEAMACAVPCVATDSGDVSLIIGDTGVIVPPRDPEALAAAWARLAALGAAGRAALGAKARARIIKNYDLDRAVSRYAALHEEIAGSY